MMCGVSRFPRSSSSFSIVKDEKKIKGADKLLSWKWIPAFAGMTVGGYGGGGGRDGTAHRFCKQCCAEILTGSGYGGQ
jgi:hypothetical protein